MRTLPQLKRKRLQPSGPPDSCYYRRLFPHWLPLYDVRKAHSLNSKPWSRFPFWFSIIERFRNEQSCRWCGSDIVQEVSSYASPRHLCLSCRFEQNWLKQCKDIQIWAQERLRDKEALILDTVLTVNRNGTVWLCICADLYLLKLNEMLMGRLLCTIAVDGHHIQNDAVVDHTVDGSHGGQGIFENAFPFAEHEIGGDEHRFAFIALGKERKEHLHFVTIVLNVANIIEDDTGIFVQLGQLLGQAKVAFSGEEPLHEGAGWRPPDGMTRQDELIPKCGQDVTFPNARPSQGNHIDCLLQKRSALESFDLELERGREPLQVKGAEGFLQW
jgi:hypothetical protein